MWRPHGERRVSFTNKFLGGLFWQIQISTWSFYKKALPRASGLSPLTLHHAHSPLPHSPESFLPPRTSVPRHTSPLPDSFLLSLAELTFSSEELEELEKELKRASKALLTEESEKDLDVKLKAKLSMTDDGKLKLVLGAEALKVTWATMLDRHCGLLRANVDSAAPHRTAWVRTLSPLTNSCS